MGLDLLKRQRRQGLEPLPDEEVVAFLEPGIEIEGQMTVTGGLLRLNCQFKGEIHSVGTIIVPSQGDVEADIEALQISIAGKVKGHIRATERLEIKENGILLGDVETPTLVVDPGAYFSGHCEMPTDEIEKTAPNEVDSDRERT
ncbi:MAG TPA: polymer-forming cytoskeletal protein [Terriglobia bacterium]|nr:polymer-forming cytoskeletal protein [Terriglobia bacterium]